MAKSSASPALLAALKLINGVPLGTTPFEKDYSGGYFHKTQTVVGACLSHPLIARLSFQGYAIKEIAVTTRQLDPSAISPAVSTGTVNFAEPFGAEIYVDGQFVGNIPSSIQLPEGHQVQVKCGNSPDCLKKSARPR
jgi:hypothetical protein